MFDFSLASRVLSECLMVLTLAVGLEAHKSKVMPPWVYVVLTTIASVFLFIMGVRTHYPLWHSIIVAACFPAGFHGIAYLKYRERQKSKRTAT